VRSLGTHSILCERRAPEVFDYQRSHRDCGNRGFVSRAVEAWPALPATGDGFFEWHLNDQERKAPYYIHLADQPIFAFAALWDRSVKADGTAVESVVHITMPGNGLMRFVHNTGDNPHRMPAILKREDHEAWLTGSAEDARKVLVQYPENVMEAFEVTTRVNSPKNNSPTNIEPITGQP
jgi:putative SOS response-associated peptidase YedK